MFENPETLLRYFEARMRESANPEWVLGIRLTARWIELRNMPDVTEAQFQTLLAELEEPESPPGSAMFELWMQVRHWGYKRGFAVPDDHPWRGYPFTAKCAGVGEYVQQLTPGKSYRVQAQDQERQLTRVVNDQGRTRWYPSALFQYPEDRTREWLRKTGDS